MKQTVIENTCGLWEQLPHRNIEVPARSKREEKKCSCFYEIDSAAGTPLWGSTVVEDSPFTRPFDQR